LPTPTQYTFYVVLFLKPPINHISRHGGAVQGIRWLFHPNKQGGGELHGYTHILLIED